MSSEFAPLVLAWHATHGRHDLPWQHPRTPYRVWVSEIMLQQTQVATVIPYFETWMERFPDVVTLAESSQDEVLRHWAGLGYYARARNLHAAAKMVVGQHGGELPADPDALMQLPGIGRSTAAAIVAQAWNRRAVILDGNVKRVLARYRAIDGWPGRRAVEKRLWELADALTPPDQAAQYTQAIMDLGATLCRRTRPRCDACPVAESCIAAAQGNPQDYPGRAPKRERPLRHTRMLLATNDSGEVFLERRPGSGVWGGLWCLPEIPEGESVAAYCGRRLGAEPQAESPGAEIEHSFTHFDLRIAPIAVKVTAGGEIRDAGDTLWLNLHQQSRPGLPAPVARLLESQDNTE